MILLTPIFEVTSTVSTRTVMTISIAGARALWGESLCRQMCTGDSRVPRMRLVHVTASTRGQGVYQSVIGYAYIAWHNVS